MTSLRKRNPDKHTADLWQVDYDYLDEIRKFDIGQSNIATAVHKCVLAHKYCVENGILVKGEV